MANTRPPRSRNTHNTRKDLRLLVLAVACAALAIWRPEILRQLLELAIVALVQRARVP